MVQVSKFLGNFHKFTSKKKGFILNKKFKTI